MNSGEAVFLGLGAGSVLAGKSTAAAGQTGSQILTQLLKVGVSEGSTPPASNRLKEVSVGLSQHERPTPTTKFPSTLP